MLNNQVPTQAKANFESMRSKFKLQMIVPALEKTESKQHSSVSDIPLTPEPLSAPLHEDTPTAKNIKDFYEDYEVREAIGDGANGWVKRCIHRKSDKEFAVKMSEIEEQHILNLKNIFKAMRNLNHPYILKYHAMYIAMKKHMCFLVMDYIPQPSLSHYIYQDEKDKNRKPLTQDEIKSIMRQLLETLKYLHSHKMCHRDIKPDNILFNRDSCCITLIDFGVSKVWMEKGNKRQMLTNTGTADYKAPELYEGGSYTHAIDMWAAGVVLFEMVEGRLPFREEYLLDTIQNITDINFEEGHQWTKISRHARDLMRRLLKTKEFRLQADSALKVPWFLEDTRGRMGSQILSSSTLHIQYQYANSEVEQIEFTTLSPMVRQNTVNHSPSEDNELVFAGPTLTHSHSISPPSPSITSSQTASLQLTIEELKKINFDDHIYSS